MNRKVISFVIAIPALFLLFIFKILPAVDSLILSMKNFQITRGVLGSPGVGFNNYSMFLQTPEFACILRNTIWLNLLSITITCVFTLVLIICISRMPNKWWKLGAILLISIPSFIPIVSFVGVFMKAFSPDMGSVNQLIAQLNLEPKLFFGDPSWYPVLFAVMDAMRSVCIPVIIGVLVCERTEHLDLGNIALVIIGYIAARATMLLSPDLENILVSYNPLVYSSADVFDTYTYRTGFMQMQFGVSSAVWVLKTIVQLVINIGIYVLLSMLLPRISEAVEELGDKVNRSMDSIIGIIGYILFALGSIAVVILTFSPGTIGFSDAMGRLLASREFMPAIVNSLIYCVLSCILYGLITLTLAYPLTAKSKLYPLILVVIMSLTNNFIGENIVYRGIGGVNTLLPIVLSSGLSIMGAFALYFSIFNRFEDDVPNLGEYIKAAILPLITIMTLAFIANWGSYIYQLIYLNNRSLQGISLMGMQLLVGQDGAGTLDNPNSRLVIEAIKSAYIFITSLLPVFLGTILICLSKFLPLSAFSTQIRKG